MAVDMAYPDRCFVDLAEQIVSQGLGLAAIGHHRALFEQDDAIDLWRDLIEMVGDDDDILSFAGQAADLP